MIVSFPYPLRGSEMMCTFAIIYSHVAGRMKEYERKRRIKRSKREKNSIPSHSLLHTLLHTICTHTHTQSLDSGAQWAAFNGLESYRKCTLTHIQHLIFPFSCSPIVLSFRLIHPTIYICWRTANKRNEYETINSQSVL